VSATPLAGSATTNASHTLTLYKIRGKAVQRKIGFFYQNGLKRCRRWPADLRRAKLQRCNFTEPVMGWSQPLHTAKVSAAQKEPSWQRNEQRSVGR
jgi:hypothetical protein